MNWKRGLTRTYVVLCLLVAVGGIWFAVEATKEKLTTRTALGAFLKRHGLSVSDLRNISSDSLVLMIVRKPDTWYLGMAARERFPGAYEDLPFDEIGRLLIRNYPMVGNVLTEAQLADSINARPNGVTESEALGALRWKGYTIESSPDTLPAVAVFFASARNRAV